MDILPAYWEPSHYTHDLHIFVPKASCNNKNLHLSNKTYEQCWIFVHAIYWHILPKLWHLSFKKKKMPWKAYLSNFNLAWSSSVCSQAEGRSSYLQQAEFCCIDYQFLCAKAANPSEPAAASLTKPCSCLCKELLLLSLHSSVMLTHAQPHSQRISNQLYSHWHLLRTFSLSFTEDLWTNSPPYTNNPHTHRMTEAF